MIRVQKEIRCLGSKALLTIVQKRDNAKVHNIIEEIIDIIEKFEDNFSRFKVDSELTKFNINAGEQTKISGEFKNILNKSIKLSSETDSAFNLFILPSLQKAGYDKSWIDASISSDQFKNSKVVDMNQLELGNDWAKIPLNTAIDLGGIGKGYMLDKISNFLIDNKIENYWISLGGDLICKGLDVNNEPWNVSVADALNDNNIVDSISTRSNKVTAIATSSLVKRKGFTNNRSWNHIINPKTLEPTHSKILSATVIADSGIVADVMAKSIIINGDKFAEMILMKGKIKSFILQYNDKTIRIEKYHHDTY